MALSIWDNQLSHNSNSNSNSKNGRKKKPDRKIYQVRSVSKLSPEYFETRSEVKQKINM